MERGFLSPSFKSKALKLFHLISNWASLSFIKWICVSIFCFKYDLKCIDERGIFDI